MNFVFSTLILYVKDVKNLKAFYTVNFGLKTIEQDDYWVLLGAGNIQIGFHKMGNDYLGKVNQHQRWENNTKMVFETDSELEIVRNDFISRNIEMRAIKTFDDCNYWLCDGIDPEGNVFQIKSYKKGTPLY